jgi:hypothetical protein
LNILPTFLSDGFSTKLAQVIVLEPKPSDFHVEEQNQPDEIKEERKATEKLPPLCGNFVVGCINDMMG